jgi:hypothetical protein
MRRAMGALSAENAWWAVYKRVTGCARRRRKETDSEPWAVCGETIVKVFRAAADAGGN